MGRLKKRPIITGDSNMALSPNKLEQAEFHRIVFSVTPELGTTINQVLDPKYWVHVAAKLKPRSRIEVLAEDNSYFAELLVVSSDKTWASVALLRYVDLSGNVKNQKKEEKKETTGTSLDEFNTEKHYVDFVQGSGKGRVILREGKVVVKDGFTSKKDAAVWMRAHEAELEKQLVASTQTLME